MLLTTGKVEKGGVGLRMALALGCSPEPRPLGEVRDGARYLGDVWDWRENSTQQVTVKVSQASGVSL